jgi:hypothetical protein
MAAGAVVDIILLIRPVLVEVAVGEELDMV